jgi:hypothetical protein
VMFIFKGLILDLGDNQVQIRNKGWAHLES